MKRLVTLLFLFAPFAVRAQTTIQGLVISTTGDTIIGASVTVVGTYDGAATDIYGMYVFTTHEQGVHQVKVSSIGYEEQFVEIELTKGKLIKNFHLKEKFNSLKAVNITAGAFEAGDEKKAVVLTSLDMITVPGASGNVVGALQFLPGTSPNGESGKLFVRGGNSRESQIYIDGAIVHSAYNPSAPNTAVRSRFNPFMFGGTVFSTGGFSAEYGQALSSVLLLDTKELQEEDQLDISLLSVGAGVAGTKRGKKSAITASYDYLNLAPYIKLVPQNIDWVKMPVAHNGAITVRQKLGSGLLKVYTAFNHNDFELIRPDLNNGLTPTQYALTNSNLYVNSSWKGNAGKKLLLKFASAFTADSDRVEMKQSHFEEELKAAHFKTVATYYISDKVKLLTGAEAIAKEYGQEYESLRESNLESFRSTLFAGFTELNVYASTKLVARLGGRFEFSDYLNRSNVAPRISAAYQVSDNAQISAAYGLFLQEPKNEYLLYTDQILFEEAKQYMINFQWSKKGRTIRTEIYLKEYTHLSKFDEKFQFYNEAYYQSMGHGDARGIDLFYRDNKTVKNGEFWVSYSYLDTKRDYLGYPELATPRFASKHNLSVVYKHWVASWRCLFGVSYSYSSPRVYDDPNTAQFNDRVMKEYQTLNLNCSYLHRQNIIFYFSATNVPGFTQEFGQEYATIPNAEGVYDSIEILPTAKRMYILGCFITLSKDGEKNQLDKIN